MINKEILLASGYKRYDPNPIINEYATDIYQKPFSDERGKKYFITFSYLPPYAGVIPEVYEADMTINEDHVTGCSINFKLWNMNNASLQQIEEKFERIWLAAGSNYYEKSENYYVKCDLCGSDDCDGHYGEGFQ